MATFVLVDDSDPFRTQLHRILRNAGHTILGEARDGREGLALIARFHPDAVTLDVSMPVLNGDIVANDLLDREVHPAIFMVTSMAQESVYKPLVARGAYFIAKPYKEDRVLKTVARWLDGKS